jgi:hypothetical protein
MSSCNRSHPVASLAIVATLAAALVGLAPGVATAVQPTGTTVSTPRAHVERGLLMGTAYFNRQETGDAAAAGSVAETCAILADAAGGSPGWAIANSCTIYGTAIAVEVHRAEHRGMCVQIMFPWVIGAMPLTRASVYEGEYCY